MILFSERRGIERLFEGYCRETNTVNCASNFIAWLLSTKIGKNFILKMYSELIERLLDEL